MSSLLYVAMNILVPPWYEGYSSISQTVSELSAINAPTRTIWVVIGFLYTLLVAGFGLGLWQSAAGNRSLRITGILLLIYGIIGLGWPLAPMHQREVLAAGGGTLSDTLHIVFSIVTVALMLVAMGFGAVAFDKRFRFYSFVTIVILLAFGYLTSMDGPRIAANLPTPWIGVWERILIGVFLIWIVVLSIIVLRKEKNAGSSTTVINRKRREKAILN